MAKLIKLPSGGSIDLEQGEIRTPFGRGPIPINHNTHTYTYRQSLWDRFDYFIGNIGNWFADSSETITSVLAVIMAIIGFAIPFIGWLISLGWLWGIVAGIFLGGIVYYVAMIVIGIFIWISNIGLAVIRYIFYSGITFLITLAVIAIIALYSIPQNKEPTVSNTVVLEPNYYCNVNTVLNVRERAGANAKIIGQLKRHEDVYVYSIANNFAKIDFKGVIAYVSADYLSSQSVPKTNNNTKQLNQANAVEQNAKDVNLSNISTIINRVWTEHNVYQDNQKGMKIHVSFKVGNMQNIQGKCIAYFYHKNGVALKDSNNSYRSTEGKVIVEQNFKPGYKETQYEDLALFIPYNELHIFSDSKTDLKANVVLFACPKPAQSKKLATSDWTYFWYGS